MEDRSTALAKIVRKNEEYFSMLNKNTVFRNNYNNMMNDHMIKEQYSNDSEVSSNPARRYTPAANETD